jgi:hypothetical protein
VLCGDSSGYAKLSWIDFSDTIKYICTRPNTGEYDCVAVILARDLFWKSTRVELVEGNDIKKLGVAITGILPMISTMKATIAQDKAYGLYAILQFLGITMTDPDYSKSVEKTFEELAFALIRDTRSLQMLRYVCTNGRKPGLPSWVPDWEGKHSISYELDPTLAYTHTSVVDQPQKKHLRIAGRGVDRVKIRALADFSAVNEFLLKTEHVMVLSNEEETFQTHMPKISIWKEWLKLVQGIKSYPTKKSVLAALLETLTQGSMTTAEDLKAFEVWYSVLQYPESCTYDISNAAEATYDLELKDELGKGYWTDGIRACVTIVLALYYSDAASRNGKSLPYARQLKNLYRKIFGLSPERAFFITHSGYMGSGYHKLREGDNIVLFQGTKEPMILRSVVGGCHEFIGTAYVSGLVDINTEGNDTDKDLEKFILI